MGSLNIVDKATFFKIEGTLTLKELEGRVKKAGGEGPIEVAGGQQILHVAFKAKGDTVLNIYYQEQNPGSGEYCERSRAIF